MGWDWIKVKSLGEEYGLLHGMVRVLLGRGQGATRAWSGCYQGVVRVLLGRIQGGWDWIKVRVWVRSMVCYRC